MTESDCDRVEMTVMQLVELHQEHTRSASPLQRAVARATLGVSRPVIVVGLLGAVGAWMLGNYIASLSGIEPVEGFPFPGLALCLSFSSLLVSLMILATQRREEEFARRQTHLTLQLAALSEQKIAKVIALIEEQRRESPILSNRVDREAETMARPVDHRAVIDRLDRTVS